MFSLLKSLVIAYNRPNANMKETFRIKKNFLLFSLDAAQNHFWNKNWFGKIWHRHPGGFHNARKIRGYSLVIKNQSRENFFEPLRKNEFFNKYTLSPNVQKRIDFYNQNHKRDESNNESDWLQILLSSLLFADAHIQFEKNYRKIRNPWQTFYDLEKFQNLIGEPESLYNHLLKTCPEIIDKTNFLKQYYEYDQKPYSMRKMIKEILDKGEENYPTFSNEEVKELSIKLLNELCDKEVELLKRKGKL